MACGVRKLKTRTIVHLTALEEFVRRFDGADMISALAELCDFAATHPDFDQPGKPGADEWFLADEATDYLMEFFTDPNCVTPGEEAWVPNVELNAAMGTVALIRRRRRKRSQYREFEDATAPVAVRNRKDSAN